MFTLIFTKMYRACGFREHEQSSGVNMKKKIALLLLLLLALTAALAACNQTAATKIIPRWSVDGETYEYRVELADFDTSEKASTRFCRYPAGDETYYKDFLVRAGEPFDSLDEVQPMSVDGTYKLTISYKDDYDTVKAEQSLQLTYNTADGALNLTQEFLAALEQNDLIVERTGSSITLQSTTETTVSFKRYDNGKQAPKSSGTTVKGFYIGRQNQEVSCYEISTEYSYENKHAVANVTLKRNGETEEISTTLKGYTEGRFIDSNQLLMYTRSLDKASGSFQDSPSVAVFNPFNQLLQTANFTLTAEANAVLTDKTRGDDEQLFVKLPVVGVTVGGLPFMVQESVPNLLDEQGRGVDRAQFGTDWYAKHTPVRFRVGYLSYELSSYDDAIWNALKAR